MRTYIILPLFFITTALFGQTSDDIIPKDAITVFSLNNFSILQKVSMDELVSYDFMKELQSELFDGSTSGKTLKDAGIDFNQKMNIFFGKNSEFEISGFTFGISDKEKLFTVFDDFDRVESELPNVEYYNNYFNHLMIRGNVGLLIRVDTDQEHLTEIADSIWTSRGFELPWMYENEDYYEGTYDESDPTIENDEMMDENDAIDEGDEIEEVYEEEGTPIADENSDLYNNYYELRDSLEYEMSKQRLTLITRELFIDGKNLKANDVRLANQLAHKSDGVFYMDNSRNFKNTSSLWYFQTMFPDLYKDVKDLYSGNIVLGDISLNQQTIDIRMEANYGDALGSIYEELNGSKFDKNVLRYVSKDNAGFFTYNIDLKKGYEKAYEIIIPILSQEKNARISANVLMVELMNEFINTDEVFNTYKGSMFGTFNGIKRVKTKRIEFFYDEETFEYGEREIEAEEDMPLFTLGFSTARPDVPNKILKHMSRITSQFKNMGNYWVYEDAILNSLPLYMINKNGLFILTNDEDLAKNHSDGYGKMAISGKAAKRAAKSGSVYGFLNLGDIINRLPEELLSNRNFELVRSLKGKKGELEVFSSKTTRSKTVYNMTYTFDDTYNNAGKYLLDLFNTAYVLSTEQ